MTDMLNVSLFFFLFLSFLFQFTSGSSSHDQTLPPGAAVDVRSIFIGATGGTLPIRGIGTASPATVELDALARSGDAVTLAGAVASTAGTVVA